MNCLLENKLYPENQERTACVEYATVYSPPEELQIPEGVPRKPVQLDTNNQSMTESTISNSSEKNSKMNSPSEDPTHVLADLSGNILDIDSKSNSTTATPIAKTFPR